MIWQDKLCSYEIAFVRECVNDENCLWMCFIIFIAFSLFELIHLHFWGIFHWSGKIASWRSSKRKHKQSQQDTHKAAVLGAFTTISYTRPAHTRILSVRLSKYGRQANTTRNKPELCKSSLDGQGEANEDDLGDGGCMCAGGTPVGVDHTSMYSISIVPSTHYSMDSLMALDWLCLLIGSGSYRHRQGHNSLVYSKLLPPSQFTRSPAPSRCSTGLQIFPSCVIVARPACRFRFRHTLAHFAMKCQSLAN